MFCLGVSFVCCTLSCCYGSWDCLFSFVGLYFVVPGCRMGCSSLSTVSVDGRYPRSTVVFHRLMTVCFM